MRKPTPKDETPLQPRMALEPTDKWDTHFIGPFDPPSGQKKYIIVCTDYLKKWDETKAIKVTTEVKVAKFQRDKVFYNLGTLES